MVDQWQNDASRGPAWLEVGPRNGPHGPFDKFELIL